MVVLSGPVTEVLSIPIVLGAWQYLCSILLFDQAIRSTFMWLVIERWCQV